jgi:hypothetical protein
MRIPIAWLRDEREVVSPRRMRHIADCGKTRVYEPVAAREFEPYLNSRSRRITAHSLRRYLARRLANSAGE